MAYKKLTINNVAADILALDDVITGTITEGGLLQKQATDWGTTIPSAAADSKLGYLANVGLGNDLYKYDIGDNYIWRKASGEIFDLEDITFVNSSGSYVPNASGSWAMGFTFDGTAFNGKKVLLYALPNPTRYANTSSTFQWGVGTGALSSWTPIGIKADQTQNYGAPCWALYTGSGTTETLTLKVIDKTGALGITDGTFVTIGQLFVKVIG